MARRTLRTLVALSGAIAIESYITVGSGFTRAHDYLYGAPFAVGLCHNDALLSLASSCSFSWPLFLLDIALTAALLIAIAEPGGVIGLVGGILAALLTVRVFPPAADGAVDLVPLWLATIVVAGVIALVAGGAVRIRRRGGSIQRSA
jgi:hypothetical protein